MKKIFKILIGILLLVVIAVTVHFIQTSKTRHDPIKIGVVVSSSGAGAAAGEILKEGFTLAQEDLEKEGINVKVFYEDDETNAKNAVSAVQSLHARGVDAVVGFNWDFLYNASVATLDREHLIGITPSNSSEYTTPSEYGFTMAPKTSDSEDLVVEFLKEHHIKRISFLASKFSWSEVHLENLKRAAKRAGAEIVSEDWFLYGQEIDTIDSITLEMKKKKPDLIFVIAGGDRILSAFFRRIQQLELQVPMLAGTTAIAPFLQRNPDVLSENYPFYSLVPKSSPEFVNYFVEKKGSQPGEHAERAYDSMIILAHILDSKHSIDLKDYLESHELHGFKRTYSFDRDHGVTGGQWQIRKDN